MDETINQRIHSFIKSISLRLLGEDMVLACKACSFVLLLFNELRGRNEFLANANGSDNNK